MGIKFNTVNKVYRNLYNQQNEDGQLSIGSPQGRQHMISWSATKGKMKVGNQSHGFSCWMKAASRKAIIDSLVAGTAFANDANYKAYLSAVTFRLAHAFALASGYEVNDLVTKS